MPRLQLRSTSADQALAVKRIQQNHVQLSNPATHQGLAVTNDSHMSVAHVQGILH